MKVSVITVCYNANSTIEGCLRSVAQQTHTDIEHIVIDGQSSDGTIDTVRRYPHVTILISERDHGLYDAMNKGLDKSTGDYVIFINADDRFSAETTLAEVVQAIQRDPGGDVYYGSLEVRPSHGAPFVFRPPPRLKHPSFWFAVACRINQRWRARPCLRRPAVSTFATVITRIMIGS